MQISLVFYQNTDKKKKTTEIPQILSTFRKTKNVGVC